MATNSHDWLNRGATGQFVSGPKRYEVLYKYRAVEDWSQRFSTERAKWNYLIPLLDFCLATGMSPDDFLKLPAKQARDKIWDHIKQFRDHPRTALNKRNALVNFYRHHNEVKLEFDSRKGGKHYIRQVKKKIDIEIIPPTAQIYDMAQARHLKHNKRDVAIILTLFQSGIRNNALCHLRYSHIREQLENDSLPLRLKITDTIDVKLAGKQIDYYYTFLQKEAVQALKEYINECKAQNVKWVDETPLFLSRSLKPMNESDVWRVIKLAAKDAGLNPSGVWPHCLRKSFRKVLNACPEIDEDTKEVIMGHSLPGSRGNYFDSHDLEEIAQKYMKCNFSRDITRGDIEKVKKESALEAMRAVATTFGIDPMKVRIEKQKELRRELTHDEELEMIRVEMTKRAQTNGNEKPYSSRIISEKELAQSIEEGWEIVKELKDGRFLVRRANHLT